MNPRVFLTGRLSFYRADVTLLAPMPDIVVLLPGQEELEAIKVQEEISFRMQMISAELMAKVKIAGDWYGAVGAVLGYRSVQNYRHSQILDTKVFGNVHPMSDPTSLPRFEDDGHRLVINDGRNLEVNHLAVGALLTTGYDIILSQHFSLIPELRLRADLVSPFPDTKWNVLSIGGTIALQYLL